MSSSSFPIVYLISNKTADNNSQNYEPYQLVCSFFFFLFIQNKTLIFFFLKIVYHALNATICVFIPLNIFNNLNATIYLNNLANFFDLNLNELAKRICDANNNLPKSIQNDISFNFIYYNSDSLSVRTSFTSLNGQQFSTVGLPPINIHK